MNVSGIDYDNRQQFSEILSTDLISSLSTSEFSFSLMVNVSSMAHIIFGRLSDSVTFSEDVSLDSKTRDRRLDVSNLFDNYYKVNYRVFMNTFDAQLTEDEFYNLIYNVTSSLVMQKTLDHDFSKGLNKSVVVLSYELYRSSLFIQYNSPFPTSSPATSSAPTRPQDTTVKSVNNVPFAKTPTAIYIYVAAALIFFILLFTLLISFRNITAKRLERKYNSSRNIIEDREIFIDGSTEDNEDRNEDGNASEEGGDFFDEPHRLTEHHVDYESEEDQSENEKKANLPFSTSTSTLESNNEVTTAPRKNSRVNRRHSYELDERAVPDYERYVMPALRAALSRRFSESEDSNQNINLTDSSSIISKQHSTELKAMSSFGVDDDDVLRIEDIDINPNITASQNTGDSDGEDNDENQTSGSSTVVKRYSPDTITL